jgi:hypothetical protein
MMISFFFIFTKLCFQHELVSQQDAPTHIINFNFDKLTCNPKSIESVELKIIKEMFLSLRYQLNLCFLEQTVRL